MKSTSFTLGRFIVVAVLLLLLIGTAWGAIVSWSSITGAPISLAGKIAFVIGVCVTFALGCGLMALSYHSARSGRDEEAQYQPNKKKGDR
jgi:VanZ family protein